METSAQQYSKYLKPSLLFSAINLFLSYSLVSVANPVGPHVVDGTANFVQQDAHVAITNSNGAVINWQSFSISQGETTHFNQPSADSRVLNRVTGPDPSHLLGELSSNGKVYLVNPSGILVGEGAKIDVAGFVGSNLNITNQNFKADNLKFEANEQTSGKVENLGDIHTPNGGSVYLVGSEVSNQGVIQTPQGEIILAAGQTVEIHDTATPGVTVAVTGNSNQTTNLGQLVASSGQIGVVGAVVKNSGIINADQLVTDLSGRIFLKASKDLAIASGSQISANANTALDNPVAGNISIESDQGNISVEQNTLITANGPTGGSIEISAVQGNTTLAGDIDAIGSKGSGGNISSSAATQSITALVRLDVSGKTRGGQLNVSSISGDLNLGNGAQLKAQGAQGGSISLMADQGAIKQAALLEVEGYQLSGGQVIMQAASLIDSQGEINAQGLISGGQISLLAEQILQTGLITTDGQLDGGVISLSADKSITQLTGAVLSAQGNTGQGGSISISSLSVAAAAFTTAAKLKPLQTPEPSPGVPGPSQTLISGDLRVNGRRGGRISITGDHVGLLGNANLQADGEENGGVILIGGGLHGQDSSVANAQANYIAKTVSISAGGGVQTGVGDGGEIVVWSDQASRVYGNLSAQGGAISGNGGFIETSGHWLDTNGININATAPNGLNGTWLLDPYDLSVENTATTANQIATSGSANWDSLAAGGSVVSNTDINNQLNAGTNVVLETGIGTGGNITIDSAIATTNTGNVSLTINPDGHKLILTNNASIDSLILKLENGTILNSESGQLKNVTLGSDVSLSSSSQLFIYDKLILANNITLTIGNAYLGFADLGNADVKQIVTPGHANLVLAGGDLVNDSYLPGSGTIFTIGAGITLSGYGRLGFYADPNVNNTNSIINNGTILLNSPKQNLTIDLQSSSSSFTNNGIIAFASPSGVLNIQGNLSLGANSILQMQLNNQNRLMVSGTNTSGGVLSLINGTTVTTYQFSDIASSLKLGNGYNFSDIGSINNNASTLNQKTTTIQSHEDRNQVTKIIQNTDFNGQTLIAAVIISVSRVITGMNPFLTLQPQNQLQNTNDKVGPTLTDKTGSTGGGQDEFGDNLSHSSAVFGVVANGETKPRSVDKHDKNPAEHILKKTTKCR